jgi:hypothetical protein
MISLRWFRLRHFILIRYATVFAINDIRMIRHARVRLRHSIYHYYDTSLIITFHQPLMNYQYITSITSQRK